ncbi:MAG: phosphatase PAP2 family protein [Treponema sp.]|nr:phosphatase PAP2 family protein [Treponema sp.]
MVPPKCQLQSERYTLAAEIASMRIVSGSHFLTDVLTGAAIGSFHGWIIPFLHKRIK